MLRNSECDVTRNVERVKREGFTLIELLVVIAITQTSQQFCSWCLKERGRILGAPVVRARESTWLTVNYYL
ncbi:MAG: prepilin-type N-terminal cleavage/methylation domain-containing protein [Abditibacteriaceae bacterium]